MALTSNSTKLREIPAMERHARGDKPTADEQVVVKTFRFDEIAVDRNLIITMPKGLLGFENGHRYLIIETPDSEPFKWFQSLDDPALAFVIVNPIMFFPEYRIDVDRRELEELKIADPASVITYVIVSVPDEDLAGMSANLQGPIVVNTENNMAKQLVLVNGPYTTCHPLMKQINARGAQEPGDKTTNASSE